MTDPTAIDRKELSSALEAKLKADPGAKELFCKCWPCASDVLLLVQKLPGVPQQVVDVIKVILVVGSQASSIFCK
jgi:hypothetical protein